MDFREKKVLFLDVDGTLITTATGEVFAKDITDFRVRKKVLDIIKASNISRVALVMNQGGIPEFVSEEDFIAKLKTLEFFVFTYCKKAVSSHYCASQDKDDPRRKPNTGMLEEAVATLPSKMRDKACMLMVGDASGKEGDWSDSDKMTAENYGIDYMDINDFLCITL